MKIKIKGIVSSQKSWLALLIVETYHIYNAYGFTRFFTQNFEIPKLSIKDRVIQFVLI